MFSVKRATTRPANLVRAARAPRIAAAVAIAALTISMTAACSRTSPVQTADFYQPGDGEVVNMGKEVDARNLLILADHEQTVAQVDGVLVNNTKADVTVKFAGKAGEFDASVKVPAGKSVRIGPGQDTQIKVDPKQVKPGAAVQSTLTGSTNTTYTVAVPVLDDTQEEYKPLLKLMKEEAAG